jgi:ABC-type multidrug transport system ATPase subunit
MDEHVLTVDQVQKQIKSQTIVHDVSIAVPQGRVTALCGGNGAGKSTILRMITGILQPTSGEIRVDGIRRLDDREGYASRIGYMPDDYAFSRGLTAYETLHFWASLRGLPKSRTEEVLEEVGLIPVRNKQVSSFSKGMKQRLLFGQAILAKPPLLVLDEPTNGLDPYWMDAFVQLVLKAKADGHAIIYSTHQLPVAEASADEVVFLHNGEVSRAGTVSSFLEEYGAGGLHAAFSSSLNGRSLPR